MTLGFGEDRRILFSAHVSDWTHVPTTTWGAEMRLIDVRLVTPPTTNGSADWKMERLLEVWQGDEPASGFPAWVFIAEGDRRYVQAGATVSNHQSPISCGFITPANESEIFGQ